ncbi:gluconate 5-dehydrogenase [human gut metagenome]|uniref:Gluconate 5-dehydrogenase n=1 Tax=human gut metagenome TaxID=408170 RepID=K1TQZ0_9ZZZZ
MIAQGGGKIINICSMMSELGRETVSAYAAAKGGLKMLTKNIASEYGEYNIQCNGIGPGYIATPQTAPLREISPTAAVIRLTSSSLPRPLPSAGAKPRIWAAQPCSSLPRHPTLSTV